MGLPDLCDQVKTGRALGYELIVGLDLPASLPPDCDSSSIAEAFARTPALAAAFLAGGGEGGGAAGPPKPWRDLATLKPLVGGRSRRARKALKKATMLWAKGTVDEAVTAVLLLADVVAPVPIVRQQTTLPSPRSIARTATGCQGQMVACLGSRSCRRGLACLVGCGLADQSCAYGCLLTYEDAALSQLSLCALEMQNVLNSDVQVPHTPDLPPPAEFRGRPLTQEVAEGILVGHFDPEHGTNHSWVVAAASNPAYSRFSNQYQLWYHGPGGGSFWYNAAFQMEAENGTALWASRRYSVARGRAPGVWRYSAMDSGIFLDERWHLLGADGELRWLALFFVGAARHASMVYRGCLLLTKDGSLPTGQALLDAQAAVARAGMRMWELVPTRNTPPLADSPPPLESTSWREPASLLRAA